MGIPWVGVIDKSQTPRQIELLVYSWKSFMALSWVKRRWEECFLIHSYLIKLTPPFRPIIPTIIRIVIQSFLRLGIVSQ